MSIWSTIFDCDDFLLESFGLDVFTPSSIRSPYLYISSQHTPTHSDPRSGVFDVSCFRDWLRVGIDNEMGKADVVLDFAQAQKLIDVLSEWLEGRENMTVNDFLDEEEEYGLSKV